MASDDEDGTRVPTSESSKSGAMQEPDDAVDFFRKKKSMSQILEEKRRRAKEKKQKSERRRSSQTTSVERADPAVQDNKRRRVSREDDEDGNGSDRAASHRTPSPAKPRNRSVLSKSPQPKQPHRSLTLSGNYNQLTANKSKSRTPQPADILTLSDSDDDPLRPLQNQTENNSNANIVDDEGPDDDDLNPSMANGERQDEPISLDQDSESEDEFAYLVVAAREKAAKQKESIPSASEADVKKSEQEKINAKVRERLEQYRRTGSLAKSVSDSSSPKKAAAITPKPAPPVDPNVEILVTSKIEGTKPLMFIRKLSQRLKEVRLSWCDRQDIGLTESQRESIFLTWKGTKVFDSSTCQRMPGLRVNGGRVDTYGDGFEDGKLHMEAWTPEAFQEFRRGKALGRQRYIQDEEEEEEREPTPEQVEPKWRLVLKSPGIDDFKLVVKAQTRIAKIISSFQSERNIAEDKDVSLWFDGDMLDPEDCVRDVGFEDYDAIEVRVR